MLPVRGRTRLRVDAELHHCSTDLARGTVTSSSRFTIGLMWWTAPAPKSPQNWISLSPKDSSAIIACVSSWVAGTCDCVSWPRDWRREHALPRCHVGSRRTVLRWKTNEVLPGVPTHDEARIRGPRWNSAGLTALLFRKGFICLKGRRALTTENNETAHLCLRTTGRRNTQGADECHYPATATP